MPRKTLEDERRQSPPDGGFNEAAARCRGKQERDATPTKRKARLQ